MKQMDFKEFAEDKLSLIKMAGFYGGQPPTTGQRQRIDELERLINEYEEKIERGMLWK